MKKLLLSIFFSVIVNTLYSQNESKLRLDYNTFTFYDRETETWSEWTKGNNTFITNCNDNGDICHITPNGKSLMYKKLSAFEVKYLADGAKYRVCIAVNENGDDIIIQIFDNIGLGIIITSKSQKSQFSYEE